MHTEFSDPSRENPSEMYDISMKIMNQILNNQSEVLEQNL
jgi:hypothetical protein